MKKTIFKVKRLLDRINVAARSKLFSTSSDYWEKRYVKGGNSGLGSYGKFAKFKADVLNEFVLQKKISSVIEFGSGDGNQLKSINFPRYIGVDVSDKAVANCVAQYQDDSTKRFVVLNDYDGEMADLSLSLDVIYHLVEDDVYLQYMRTLFDASHKYVVVYASNTEEVISKPSPHVRHRKFSDWVESERPSWKLIDIIPNKYPCINGDDVNGSFADFYFYEKQSKK